MRVARALHVLLDMCILTILIPLWVGLFIISIPGMYACARLRANDERAEKKMLQQSLHWNLSIGISVMFKDCTKRTKDD
jgi:hypothetical protein